MRYLSVVLFFALAGCVTAPWKNSAQLLPGYQSFNPPRTDVPIGAVWMDGPGYMGAGLPLAQIRVQDAPDMLTDFSSRAAFEANIATMLGLSVDTGSDSSVQLKSIQIESVADYTDLPFGKADAFIVNAVRVKDFSIKTKSNNAGDISGEIAKKPGVSGASVVASTTDTVDVSGSDLYVAYKVLRTSKPKIASKSLSFNYKPSRVTVDGYTLEAKLEDNYPCKETPHFHWSVSNPDILADGVGLSVHRFQRASSDSDSRPRWVTSSGRVPIRKSLSKNVVTEVQVEFAFAGTEDFYSDGFCQIMPKQATATLSVARYGLLSDN